MAQRVKEREDLSKKIVKGLYQEGMILTWYRDKPKGWPLAGGLWSPFFINLRLISSGDPELYRNAGRAMSMLMQDIGFVPDGRHRAVGIAMAGIPLANAITLETGIPSSYTRKLPEEVKKPEDVERYLRDHGERALVEGNMKSGDRLVLVDDLVTGFDSKLLAASQVQQEIARKGLVNVTVENVVVLLDREQGASERAASLGFDLRSFIPFKSKGLDWLRDELAPIEYATVKNYLRDPQKYQDPELQNKLMRSARHYDL